MQGSSRIQIVLVVAFAISVSGCWAWKCGKNYSLGVELEQSVGDPMVFVETFVEHKRSHERYPSHPGTFKEELIYTGRRHHYWRYLPRVLRRFREASVFSGSEVRPEQLRRHCLSEMEVGGVGGQQSEDSL